MNNGAILSTDLGLPTSALPTDRRNLINWVRGTDNASDESGPADSMTTRPSVHGDVLHSRPVEVNTVSTYHGCFAAACACGVAAGLAYLKYPACLDHGHDLLLQLFHELVAQLSSQTKKAEAFLNLCTSPYGWRFFDSNWRMRWCSAVMGLRYPVNLPDTGHGPESSEQPGV